jgi:membrane protease YdiL (CAAX protease family)
VLAGVAALGWTGVLLVSAGTALRGSELVRSSLGATAGRRARGAWWPEAAVLGVIGATAVAISWIGVSYPPRWGVARVAIPLLVGGAALLAPTVLASPSLLAVRRVGGAAWGAALGVGVGVGGAWMLVPWLGFPLALGGVDPVRLGAHLALDAWPALVFGSCACAVGEELMYRGAIQGLWARNRPARALVVQATLYGLAPLLGFLMPSAWVAGLLLGALRWRSGSILPCVLAGVVGRIGLSVAAHLAGGWPDPRLGAALVAIGAVSLLVLPRADDDRDPAPRTLP